MKNFCCLSILFCSILVLELCHAEMTVCYYGSWAVYRPDTGSYDVDDIDPFICTDLIFGFAGVNNNTWEIEVLDPWNEDCSTDDPAGNNCAYDRFVALKEVNPALTVTLAVGGWNEGSKDFSAMANDPVKRRIFVDSSVALVQKHKFDGLDVDWEYPTQRGGKEYDKDNFLELLRELREAFDQYDPPLRLTAAFAAGKQTVDEAYDIPSIEPYVDYFHLMSYDFHGSWENQTHHNAPLCGYANDTGEDIYFRVDFALDYYISLGAPKEKLILGIAAYGRCWTLDDVTDHGMRAPAGQPSPAGPYTQLNGTLAFNEICLQMESHDCEIVHDPDLQEPYFYCTDDSVWCGYDDEDSVYKKARYAKNMGIAGALIWTMDEEDFVPICSDIANPLITSVNKALSEPVDEDPFMCPPLGWS